MKKLIIAGAMLLSALSFADLESTIKNHYKNTTLESSQGYVGGSYLVNSQRQNVQVQRNTQAQAVRDRIISFAQTKLGSPYVWGATGPNTFDCSGFVGFVFKRTAGITLPRVSSDQAAYRPRIASYAMNKGDLVFFETTGKGRISHVGIYMGNSQFIHASSGGRRVMVSSLDTSFYNRTFRWAINPFA